MSISSEHDAHDLLDTRAGAAEQAQQAAEHAETASTQVTIRAQFLPLRTWIASGCRTQRSTRPNTTATPTPSRYAESIWSWLSDGSLLRIESCRVAGRERDDRADHPNATRRDRSAGSPGRRPPARPWSAARRAGCRSPESRTRWGRRPARSGTTARCCSMSVTALAAVTALVAVAASPAAGTGAEPPWPPGPGGKPPWPPGQPDRGRGRRGRPRTAAGPAGPSRPAGRPGADPHRPGPADPGPSPADPVDR